MFVCLTDVSANNSQHGLFLLSDRRIRMIPFSCFRVSEKPLQISLQRLFFNYLQYTLYHVNPVKTTDIDWQLLTSFQITLHDKVYHTIGFSFCLKSCIFLSLTLIFFRFIIDADTPANIQADPCQLSMRFAIANLYFEKISIATAPYACNHICISERMFCTGNCYLIPPIPIIQYSMSNLWKKVNYTELPWTLLPVSATVYDTFSELAFFHNYIISQTETLIYS